MVSMNNLALTLMVQGDYAGARPLQERVLDVSTRTLGNRDPKTVTATNNLTSTLLAQGDYAGARRLAEQALEARRRTLGENHPETLKLMTNQPRGDIAGARGSGRGAAAAGAGVANDKTNVGQ